MIDKKSLKKLLEILKYSTENGILYEKQYSEFGCSIYVDFSSQKIVYPEDKGFVVNDKTTCNFDHPENFVVFECINRLLMKGYRPEHLELEKRWTLGHEQKSGKADICVYDEERENVLCIIECKTAGVEYEKELSNMKNDGGQLFSYWQQERSAKWLILYAASLLDDTVQYKTESVDCSDDANIVELSKKDDSIKLFADAHSVVELFSVWDETYEKKLCGDVIFSDETQSYHIGIKPLRKKDLIDFSENDKIVNKFEEILRHNNVSDKENAFNRLIALFICKLVDEIQKGDEDEVEFQYKVGTDTYESLQDRLQKLHKEGMEKFMKEEIFYVADDYAEKLVQQYTGQKRIKMIEELQGTLKILKFYTNNDFAFKDVHNEELFYQNGKILVEVIQLFQEYRIIGSEKLQLLGDLFEQLLNKGFKQNEGQFFTPIPITRFIWNSLPLQQIVKKEGKIEYPRIIDYACGAGHFLTEGFEAVNDTITHISEDYKINWSWVENSLYGIEKDYRLARVSKISLFMHGAGNGNIIFGDGLENYPEKSIEDNMFDILVANPPYAVSAFKPHLKLHNNSFNLLKYISNNGSEIETLFIERISQLVKPLGVAAVVLPSAILLKDGNSFIAARESILKSFMIKAIVQFGSKTFGATGTNTVVLFLEKYDEPPKRVDLVSDSVNAVFSSYSLDEWEDYDILDEYLCTIGVSKEEYIEIVKKQRDYQEWQDNEYISKYVDIFIASPEYQNKIKQKSFKALSDEDKQKWFNSKFYEFIHFLEREKLLYFGMTYCQRTLVITAPDDNKEQEKFLGYRWSNRKGSEGIQVFNPGGMLYNEGDRWSDETLSSLIRDMFSNNERELSYCDKYYYYLKTSEMLDFKGTVFNKLIKPVKPRVRSNADGWKPYSLANSVFRTSIGDRIIVDELPEDGNIPVYSANVFEEVGKIDRLKITDFNVDSILWGIDGDWMVNIIPSNKPFFPTDHCGVLRVYSEDIIPKFLAIALEAEGIYEGFSRNKRASTQRIRDLVLLIPDKPKQERIVKEFIDVESSIAKAEDTARSLERKLREIFTEMFGNPEINEKGFTVETVDDNIDFQGGAQPDKKFFEYESTENNIRLIQIRDFKTDAYITYIPKSMARKTCDATDIMIGRYGPPIFQILKGIEGAYNVALIKAIPKKANKEFVRGFLQQECLFRYIDSLSQRTGGQTGVDMDKLKEYPFPYPPIELQEEYEKIAKAADKEISAAMQSVKTLNNKRDELMKKYFFS